jgi:single-strand DNA-binding protein
MANINPLLFGEAIGRLAKAPKIFENKDGSKSVRFTLMVKNNFKDKDGNVGAVGIDFEDFVPASREGLGVYGILDKGTFVKAMFEPRRNDWTDKDGNKHFEQVLRVTRIDVLAYPKGGAANAAAPAADEVVEAIPETVSIDEIL